jgi:hypothetical protein
VITSFRASPLPNAETNLFSFASGGTWRIKSLTLSAPLTAGLHNSGDDRQNGSAGGGSDHLANDRANVEAPQGWDQDLKDLCTDNAAYCSGDRISGTQIEVPLE